MLTLNVIYRCKPGQREAFYQELCALNIRDISTQEDGNSKYDYFFAAEAPDDLMLIEIWSDHSAWEAHSKTETFAKLQALKAQYCEATFVDRFTT